MTDPEIQYPVDRAVDELARRLGPWATCMQDPHAFAARFMQDLRDQGWRPPLRPGPDWRPRPRPAEPNDEYRANRARHFSTREESRD